LVDETGILVFGMVIADSAVWPNTNYQVP